MDPSHQSLGASNCSVFGTFCRRSHESKQIPNDYIENQRKQETETALPGTWRAQHEYISPKHFLEQQMKKKCFKLSHVCCFSRLKRLDKFEDYANQLRLIMQFYSQMFSASTTTLPPHSDHDSFISPILHSICLMSHKTCRTSSAATKQSSTASHSNEEISSPSQ